MRRSNIGGTPPEGYNRAGSMTPPTSSLRITGLRQVNSRQMEPLFNEERRHWLDDLHWDYRPSIQLISKFMDSKTLAGCAACEARSLAINFVTSGQNSITTPNAITLPTSQLEKKM